MFGLIWFVVYWHINILGLFNAKFILLVLALFKPIPGSIKRFIPFPENVMARLEFELAYYDFASPAL